MKQAVLMYRFKKASTSIRTLTIVGAPDALSVTSTCLTMKTPEHTEYKTDDSEPTDEGNIRTEYFFD